MPLTSSASNAKAFPHVLVLDGGLRQSLVAVRSLGRRGLHVIALANSSHPEPAPDIPAFSSRWCHQHFVAPSYEHGDGPYLAFLETVLDRTRPRVLIPSADGTVALIRRHRARLEKRVRVALASEPALGLAIDKEQTLRIAAGLGIGVPRGMVVCADSDLGPILKEVGLPAVVKPVESWAGGERGGRRLACTLATTREEAERAVQTAGGRVLLQQLLSGKREAVNLLYAQGRFHARFGQWAKRTQPPLGGTSVLRQSIAIPPDIGEQSERLVRAMNLEGYSEVEFRRDEQGTPFLMEINPRLSASVELAVRAGIDFPALLYQWATGEPMDEVRPYRLGTWMRHLKGDLDATLLAFTQRGRPGVTPPARAIAEFCLSFLQPMGYDYLDWGDLRPALTATRGFIQSFLNRH